jgi:hypothetical protein
MTETIKQNEIQIENVPTDDMVADYITKPTIGA